MASTCLVFTGSGLRRNQVQLPPPIRSMESIVENAATQDSPRAEVFALHSGLKNASSVMGASCSRQASKVSGGAQRRPLDRLVRSFFSQSHKDTEKS